MDDESELDLEMALRLDALSEEFAARRRADPSSSPEVFADAHPDVPRAALLAVLRGAGLLARSREQHWGPFAPGDRVGPYVIGEPLGRGGMGIVYRASEPGLGREVALKALSAVDIDARTRARFAREARAAAHLDHPAIVPVYGSGETNGVLWYAMRRVDGESLDRILSNLGADQPAAVRRRALERLESSASSASRSGSAIVASRLPLRARAAASIVARLAEALTYAHGHGIQHRDVKPANILIDENGQPLLTDFGLCKVEGDQSLTNVGDIVGTLRYMAPEALDGVFDHRGDVYGLGLVLYELCAGRPALVADSRRSMLHQVLHVEPEPLRRVAPELPLDLERIVRKATAKVPEERYATAADLADDLAALLAGKPVRARRPSPFYLLALFVRRNRALSATILAATLALVVGTILYVVQLQGAFDRASDALRQAEINASHAQVAGAEASLRTGDLSGAKSLVEQVGPDLRGWMWHHLDARVGRNSQSLRVEVGDVVGMLPSTGLGRVVVFGWGGIEVRARAGLELERRLDVNALDAVLARGGSTLVYLERHPRRIVQLDLDDPASEPVVLREHPRSQKQLPALLSCDPDGSTLLVLHGYRTLASVDLETGEELWRQELGVPRISVFRPLDPFRFVFGTTGGNVLGADARGGTAETHSLLKGQVKALLAGGGELLASGGDDGTLELYPALTGHTKVRLKLEGGVTHIARSTAEPHLLAVGLDTRGVALVDVRLGHVERILTGMTTTPLASDFAAAGEAPWLVTLSTGGDLTLHTRADHDGRIELPPSVGNALHIAASPDARWIGVGASDGLLWLHDLEDGESHVLELASSTITGSGSFAFDGTSYVHDGSVVDLETLQSRRVVETVSGLRAVAQPSGAFVFLRPVKEQVRRFRWVPGDDQATELEPLFLGWNAQGAALVSSARADRFFLATADGDIARFSGPGVDLDWHVHLDVGAPGLALDEASGELLVAAFDGHVRVFDAATGEELADRSWRASPGHSRKSVLSDVVVGPGEGMVTTCTVDGRVDTWEAATGRRIGSLQSRGSLVRHLAIVGDSQWIVCAGGFGRTLLLGSGPEPIARPWDASAAELPAVLDRPFSDAVQLPLRRSLTRSWRFKSSPWLDARLKISGPADAND